MYTKQKASVSFYGGESVIQQTWRHMFDSHEVQVRIKIHALYKHGIKYLIHDPFFSISDCIRES